MAPSLRRMFLVVAVSLAACSTSEAGSTGDVGGAVEVDSADGGDAGDALELKDGGDDSAVTDVEVGGVDVGEVDGEVSADLDADATQDDATTDSDAEPADAPVPSDGDDAEGSDGDAPCPNTCALDFPQAPECQAAVWDAEACACELVPDTGAACDDGDTCTPFDSCDSKGQCQPGPPADPGACQIGLTSVQSMPVTATVLDFDTCAGCGCCLGSDFPNDGINACIDCSIDHELASLGITKDGGQGSSMVSCITGNVDAPMEHAVLFVGTTNTAAPGEYLIELEFPAGITTFGFSGVPSNSVSMPTVELEGYNASGLMVGYDSHDFTGFVGGSCDTTNPAVQFFGFRSCCGKMTRVVARFTDANVTIDELRFL